MQKKNYKNEFDLFHKDWWEKNGIFSFLHKMNKIRLKYILLKSNGIFAKKILDIGCGGGILSESMAKMGAIVTGVDISKKSILEAQKHAMEYGLDIKYINSDIYKYKNFCKKKYDIVTCMEMLEHVKNPKSIVRICSKLVKKNGSVFFSTINRNYKSLLYIIFFAEYILQIIPKKTHQFKNFIRPNELLRFIDETRLHEMEILGMKYNFFKKKFYFCNRIDTNYILHTKKFK
ncbi:bifunctional 2-polyprenyl-6-hydroxyphenol methylase/3-demethylubiquinol 3-O-methyltransferase UbiG [bacterium endosymbiont of Pedicinus badii]|uniref:bifunctional 2-polyprenyl-6-hydroxyphenol methylase/3-demethylubiquinol 3-O-methyltransferase UbiG n=1 Tax=bacterium endosymbiont of Pedicinus badii TaxID=1719126 RepID=UPI0009BA23E8|nr:bifunctional 2-polyprenyl-6-hydroxyphenol methylase/3-demethylubiquinol 3-O-methyltransferase UbiG [bacterium endosymbiont of Pedicinus badii]OQM34442.1 3-demethylubiquinone-9 3-methyltransferase [bacterium endosymbiont of Pedicinus badii]